MSQDNEIITSHNSFITIDTILNSASTDYDINPTLMGPDNTEFRRDDNTDSKQISDTNLPTVIYRFKFTEDFIRHCKP